MFNFDLRFLNKCEPGKHSHGEQDCRCVRCGLFICDAVSPDHSHGCTSTEGHEGTHMNANGPNVVTWENNEPPLTDEELHSKHDRMENSYRILRKIRTLNSKWS